VTIKWGISSGARDQTNSANSEQQSSKEPSGDIWSQYFTHLKNWPWSYNVGMKI